MEQKFIPLKCKKTQKNKGRQIHFLRLKKRRGMEDNKGIIKFEATGGEVVLTKDLVKKYLVSGDANSVTDQELTMFMQLCRYQKLNPWLKEAYIIKYGSAPATLVTGKEAYMKRAKRNPKYQGHEAVVSTDGQSATAKVYVEGYVVPIEVTVCLDEYIGKKKDGTVNSQWAGKPRTMLRKVALSQALREAFPEDLGGLFTEEEGGSTVKGDFLDVTPLKTETVKPAAPAEKSESSQTQKPKATVEQGKLYAVLTDYCKGDQDKMKEVLMEFTSFENKDGKTIRGKDDIYKVSDAACKVARHKIEALMKESAPTTENKPCSECDIMPTCELTRAKGEACESFIIKEG